MGCICIIIVNIEMGWDWGYILEVGAAELADGLCMVSKEKLSMKDES